MKRALLLPGALLLSACVCTGPPRGDSPSDPGSDAGYWGGFDVRKDRSVDEATAPIRCEPSDAGGFAPTWVPPRPASNACTVPDIDQFAKDCLDDTTATLTACNAFQRAKKPCVTCLITPDSASAYGPVILDADGLLTLNVGGCLALQSGDLGPSSCGAKLQATWQCTAAACTSWCPVPYADEPALQAHLKCVADAEKTVCKAYADAICPMPDAGAVAACALGGGPVVDDFKKLAPIFCAAGG